MRNRIVSFFIFFTFIFSLIPLTILAEEPPVDETPQVLIPVSGIKLNYTQIVVQKGKTNNKLKAVVQPSNASDTTVTWKSQNTGIAKVNKNTGVITGVKNGSVKITATTRDGGTTASCTVIVGGQPVTKVSLNKSQATILSGKAITLKAKLAPSGASVKDVTWTSSDSSIATVSARGVVKGLKSGRTTITAASKDGGGKKAECVILVRQAVQNIVLDEASGIVLTGKTLAIKVGEVLPDDAYNKDITWKSSNKKIATVSKAGVVKGIKPGRAVITASAKDGGGAEAQYTVNVCKPVERVTLNIVSRTLRPGEKYAVKVKDVSPGDAYNKEVLWTSGNSSVASVASDGVVTGIAPGRTVIFATAQDGSGVKGECSIYVGERVSEIRLSASEVTMKKAGETFALTAAISPETAACQDVSWKSGDTKVATVDANGVVTAAGPGVALITATAADGSGVTAECVITSSVSEADARVYQGAQKVFKKVGAKLHANYLWVVKNFSYVRRSGHLTPPKGYTREQWYAVEGFETKKGNCYTYAATFSQLAKKLGYKATYIEGSVSARRGGWLPHGFVLIEMNGAKYICDPELESVGSRDLYMQPISNTKVTYKW